MTNYYKSGGLNNRNYSLMVLKARSLRSMCQQGCSHSKRSREESSLSLPSFWWLSAILGIPWPWTYGIATLITPISVSIVIWPSSPCVCPNFPLLITTPVNALGLTLIQCDLIWTWMHLRRLCFQIRSHSQIPGRHGFLEDIIQRSTVFRE